MGGGYGFGLGIVGIRLTNKCPFSALHAWQKQKGFQAFSSFTKELDPDLRTPSRGPACVSGFSF